MDQIIHTVQDLTYLSWSKIRNSSGTAGSFLKSQEDTPQGKIYYKLSDYNAAQGVTGHESVNEIIADRFLSILDIPHLEYQLIHADILVDGKPIRTWLCASYNFRQRGERKSPLMTITQPTVWMVSLRWTSVSVMDGRNTSIRCWSLTT